MGPLFMGTAAKLTSVEERLPTVTFTKAANDEEPGEQSPGACSMWVATWNHRPGDGVRPAPDLQLETYRV